MLNRNTIYDRAFAPFGEMYDTFGVTTMRDFTGDTQDIFSASPGLYDTPNRELQTTQGRWISPDPMFGNIADPQSLNRYAYVRNSPLTLVDPSGLAQTGETIKTDDVDFSFLAGDDKDSTKKTPDQTISLTFDARLLHHQKKGSNPPPPGPGDNYRFIAHSAHNEAGAALRCENRCHPEPSNYRGTGLGAFLGSKKVQLALHANLDFVGLAAPIEVVEEFAAIGSTGVVGEEALAEIVGGGTPHAYLATDYGPRFVDLLKDGWAYESKTGYQTLTADMSTQVLKDANLIQSERIQGATWHFFMSPVTGKVGPSKALFDMLTANGIGVVIHAQ